MKNILLGLLTPSLLLLASCTFGPIVGSPPIPGTHEARNLLDGKDAEVEQLAATKTASELFKLWHDNPTVDRSQTRKWLVALGINLRKSSSRDPTYAEIQQLALTRPEANAYRVADLLGYVSTCKSVDIAVKMIEYGKEQNTEGKQTNSSSGNWYGSEVTLAGFQGLGNIRQFGDETINSSCLLAARLANATGPFLPQ
jgi:hypothetical protein